MQWPGRCQRGQLTVCVALAAVCAALGAAGAFAAPAGATTWSQGSALSSPVAADTSPTAFAFAQNAVRVYLAAAADGQIHSLDYDPSLGWRQGAALTSIGLASGTRPAGFAYGTHGAVRIYFVAASDHAIHELGYNPGSGWEVTGALTPAVAAGTSPTGFQYGSGSSIRVYFVEAADGAVHQLRYDASGGFGVSAALTSPVASGTSPVSFPFDSRGVRVYFVAADHQIHSLNYDPTLGWRQSAALTRTGVAAGDSPIGFPYGTHGAVRVYFAAASDDGVHELGYNPGSGWEVTGVLTQPVAPGAGLVGYPVPGGVRVYFVGRADGELHQLSYTSSTRWSQSAGMSSPVAAGSSPAGFVGGDCDQRLYLVSAADHQIHQLSYTGPRQNECLGDLEPAAAAAPVGTAPVTVAPRPAPPHRARRRRVHVRITISWRWQGRHTWWRKARFGRLPHAATIVISCRGRGCPRHRWSSRRGRALPLLSALRGRTFAAGDRLLITIRAPREVPERAQVRIRASRMPLARLL